jgi:PAS domain S-box-containing protein
MSQPLKVLLAEDSPNDAELVLAELERAGFDTVWQRVDTEAAFLEKLKVGWDLVLSDYQMPGFTGLRALELLRQRGLETPFILVSGTIGEDIAVAAIKQGAADYLMKDRLARLGLAVTHALAESRLRRERQQASEELRVAHAQLGKLFEHSPAVLYMLKLNGTQTTAHVVSENVSGLLGFTAAELLDSAWWSDQLHPDDRERAAKSFSETLAEGTSHTEYRIQHKDGHYCWVDDSRRLVRNAAGEPSELIGVWTDISERKRAEETVRQISGRAEHGRKNRVRIDFAILLAATAAIYALSARFDWFEGAARWFRVHDATRLDDIVIAIFFVAIGLAVFAFRRLRESNTALVSQQQVQAALGLMQDELERRVKQRTTELKHSNKALEVEIAGHKQTETGLKESNRRFHEMLENVELIAMTLDKECRVTFCNDYLLDLTGWRREEVIGFDWCDKFLPKSKASVRELFFSTIGTGTTPLHHENLIMTRSGETRDIAWNNTTLRDAADNIIGIASIGEDVTIRNRAGKILRESEERFRQLAENIHEVFWIAEPSTNKVIYVSPAYEAIWGRTCASLYDARESWLSSIRQEDSERVGHAMRTKQEKGTYDEEYRIVRPDGTERWIHDRAFPVRSANGSITRCVGVAEDITESKKLQEQFYRAQRMEAIGTLAGGIAHDLNNILAPILMAPALLRDSIRNEKECRLLDVIEHSAQRGADVVRQLLTFSRGSGGERVSVLLRPVLNEMIVMMRETFPRNIEIRSGVPLDMPFIMGDSTQLHQVIMNLCVNARDSMAEGGTLSLVAKNVQLEAADVAAHPPAKPGVYIAVSIKDSGGGIPPENLERIFEPFFTTKAPTKGTGLGLSTVLGIVRSHQGFIVVTSKVGRGTTFTVYLPTAPTAVAAPVIDAGDGLRRANGELILVVDDEKLIRTATRLVLEGHGYRVLTACDGAEGLATFVANRGDVRLVLTDLMMPVMGGVSLLRAIHILDPKVRMLATSGLTDQDSHAKLEDLGVDGIVAKPCDASELLRTIWRQLHRDEPGTNVAVEFDVPLSV